MWICSLDHLSGSFYRAHVYVLLAPLSPDPSETWPGVGSATDCGYLAAICHAVLQKHDSNISPNLIKPLPTHRDLMMHAKIRRRRGKKKRALLFSRTTLDPDASRTSVCPLQERVEWLLSPTFWPRKALAIILCNVWYWFYYVDNYLSCWSVGKCCGCRGLSPLGKLDVSFFEQSLWSQFSRAQWVENAFQYTIFFIPI